VARAKLVADEKPLLWVGSSKRDLLAFPGPVKKQIGSAMSVAQFGGKHPAAKPWKGEGPGVLEMVADHSTDTYRAVYTVRFERAVFVLHAFQKKSPSGARTSARDVALISSRLRAARRQYEALYGGTTE
jgi:phage-related protein